MLGLESKWLRINSMKTLHHQPSIRLRIVVWGLHPWGLGIAAISSLFRVCTISLAYFPKAYAPAIRSLVRSNIGTHVSDLIAGTAGFQPKAANPTNTQTPATGSLHKCRLSTHSSDRFRYSFKFKPWPDPCPKTPSPAMRSQPRCNLSTHASDRIAETLRFKLEALNFIPKSRLQRSDRRPSTHTAMQSLACSDSIAAKVSKACMHATYFFLN